MNGFPALREIRGTPLIALTFDDGPTAQTEEILEILREHGAVGTFFLLGERIAGREHAVARILADGSEIGNHTFTHPRLESLGRDEIRSELEATSDAIRAASGVSPRLMRPPNGIGCEQAAPVAARLGMTVVRWSLNPKDWEPGRTADQIFEDVSAGARPSAVIVLHDGSHRGDVRLGTVAAVRQIVPELQARGYTFVTLSELLARRPLARRLVVPIPRNRVVRLLRAGLRTLRRAPRQLTMRLRGRERVSAPP